MAEHLCAIKCAIQVILGSIPGGDQNIVNSVLLKKTPAKAKEYIDYCTHLKSDDLKGGSNVFKCL